MTDLIEVLTLATALIAALAALWHKLRAERYRTRWTEARSLRVEDDAASGEWEVRLKKSSGLYGSPQWIVTNGTIVAASLDADFGYDTLASRARRTADNLAKDLNRGDIKVAA